MNRYKTWSSESVTGLLLILSAPSGTGKTTLARQLAQTEERSLFSVSYTTRAPRGNEQDGVDYHFVEETQFKQMMERGEFVEWARVHDRWYGTHERYIKRAAEGRLVLFDIDVQGGSQIKRKYQDAVSVFVLPPSLAELRQRLETRKTDDQQVIERRMKAAEAEIEQGCGHYDYIIVNRFLEEALDKLKSIVKAERCRRTRVCLDL